MCVTATRVGGRLQISRWLATLGRLCCRDRRWRQLQQRVHLPLQAVCAVCHDAGLLRRAGGRLYLWRLWRSAADWRCALLRYRWAGCGGRWLRRSGLCMHYQTQLDDRVQWYLFISAAHPAIACTCRALACRRLRVCKRRSRRHRWAAEQGDTCDQNATILVFHTNRKCCWLL